jgi:hypothetical protein
LFVRAGRPYLNALAVARTRAFITARTHWFGESAVGKQPARKLKRAPILLAAAAGVSDEDIPTSVGVGGSTIYRTKRRFVEGNLERA